MNPFIGIGPTITRRRGGGESAIYKELRALYGDWPVNMLISYESINNHATWNDTQRTNIASRLSEQHIVDTFGPSGTNKSVCDFFLYFDVHASGLTHSANTVTKTGNTLRWNYGDGNIYNQNNLPAGESTNVITVTSTDGFSSVTAFNAVSTGLIGNIFNIPYYMPNVTTINLTNSYWLGWRMAGNMTGWQFKNTGQAIRLSGNAFTGDLVGTWVPDSCYAFIIDNNYFTGTAPEIRSSHSTVSGLQYNITSNRFSNISWGGGVRNATIMNISNNCFSTPQITNFISSLKTFYQSNAPSANCTFTATGTYNGTIENGESNQNLIDLKGYFTSESYELTTTYNASTRLLTEFDQPYVSFHIDDGCETDYTKTVPLFEKYNIKCVIYYPREEAPGSGSGVTKKMSISQMQSIVSRGHEIQDHDSGTGYTSEQYADHAEEQNSNFISYGIPSPTHIAYHGGTNDSTSRTAYALTRLTGRGTAGDNTGLLNYKDTDKFNLASIGIGKTTDLNTLKDYVDLCIIKNACVTFYSHVAYNDDENPDDYPSYSTPLSKLEAIIQYVKSKNIITINMTELYNKMIS